MQSSPIRAAASTLQPPKPSLVLPSPTKSLVTATIVATGATIRSAAPMGDSSADNAGPHATLRTGGGRELASPKKTTPFDPTAVYSSLYNPPARHTRIVAEVDDREAFRPVPHLNVHPASRPVTAPGSSGLRDPRNFTLRGSGFGGGAATRHRDLAAARLSATLGAAAPAPAASSLAVSGAAYSSFGTGVSRPLTASPPKAGAKAPRNNPGNSELRRRYERSELPCILNQRGSKTTLHWIVEPAKLDMTVYLPIFFDGLREVSAWPWRMGESEVRWRGA
jgi:hypothetical protein